MKCHVTSEGKYGITAILGFRHAAHKFVNIRFSYHIFYFSLIMSWHGHNIEYFAINLSVSMYANIL